MEYRPLGRSGIRVSKLCLGTMNLGDAADESLSFRMIDYAMDQGVNFLDTANGYGGGRSEEVVGGALLRDGKRDKVVLATKVHFPTSDDPNDRGNGRRHIIEQCDASLKRLKTDRIDLYQLHRADPGVPIEETLLALDSLIQAGKIRYIGTSTFPAWRLVEAIHVAERLGVNRFVSEQPPYHMLDRQLEKTLIPAAQSYGVAVIPWSPLAGGMLTGKYRREVASGSGVATGRLGGDDEWSLRHRRAEVFDVVDLLRDIAGVKGATPSQVALAWTAQQPGITSPVFGPKNMEQLEDCLGAAELELSKTELDRIDELSPPGGSIVPYIWSSWVTPESFSANLYR